MTFLPFSPESPLQFFTSSIQAGILAFGVYLSAVILRTLLKGKSLLSISRRTGLGGHYSAGTDCIDGGTHSTIGASDHVDFAQKTITLVIEYPRNPPCIDCSAAALDDEKTLFTDEDFGGLVKCLQNTIQYFEDNKSNTQRYNWKLTLKTRGTDFAAHYSPDGIKPVITITDMYYSGTANKVTDFSFPDLLGDLAEDANGYWKNKLYISIAFNDYPLTQKKTLSCFGI